MRSDSPVSTVSRRLPGLCTAAVAIGLMLAPGAARAFTIEDGSGGRGEVPKFDLEEQSRNFRTPGADASDKRGYETPYGTLQFGMQRDSPLFGSSFDARARADRRHFDRMLAPQQFDR